MEKAQEDRYFDSPHEWLFQRLLDGRETFVEGDILGWGGWQAHQPYDEPRVTEFMIKPVMTAIREIEDKAREILHKEKYIRLAFWHREFEDERNWDMRHFVNFDLKKYPWEPEFLFDSANTFAEILERGSKDHEPTTLSEADAKILAASFEAP
jgi:hypothetical protein